MRETSVP